MLTVGIDAHKRIHVATALDGAGQEVGSWKGPNSAQGWTELLAWAKAQDPECQFGIEGAWALGRGLAQHLVFAGERVYEINARWTAEGRRRARNQEKTDRLDARAVAAFLKTEVGRMVPIHQDDDTSVLDLLTTERDSAVAESTRIRNQLHAHLLQLDPEYAKALPAFRTVAGLKAIKTYTVNDANPLRQERAAVVRNLALRLELALSQADEMAARIRKLAAPRFAPLTRLCGVNLLTAGALAGILGPGRRFATDAELAAYAGVSPMETSSAGRTRHRLNRTGNRRLNALLYRIAITQAHYSPQARAYIARRVSEGKTRREAYRALKRYLARAVFRLWAECLTAELGP